MAIVSIDLTDGIVLMNNIAIGVSKSMKELENDCRHGGIECKRSEFDNSLIVSLDADGTTYSLVLNRHDDTVKEIEISAYPDHVKGWSDVNATAERHNCENLIDILKQSGIDDELNRKYAWGSVRMTKDARDGIHKIVAAFV
ncbi:MAG: hypothetical protein R3D68_05350 [Hyphomicrobiaceae bacterium]